MRKAGRELIKNMQENMSTPNPTWSDREILSKIWEHTNVMNRELGITMNDIIWIKKFLFLLIPVLFGIIVTLAMTLIKTP